MFADTTFTMKSGQYGTSMFSRSGKCTNYQYLCFNPMQEDQAQEDKVGEETTNNLLKESEKQAMMTAKQQTASSPSKTMHETANNPGTTMHHAFGHTKTGDMKMGQTKRSSVDTAEPSKRRGNEEDDESAEKVHKKGPPVAIPGVNTSSFLGITRLKVPAVSSIVRTCFNLHLKVYS